MKRNVACLEARWSESWSDERTVEPLLHVLEHNLKIKQKHLPCCTSGEFEHHLRDLRSYKSFDIIYCAFHGSPHTLYLNKNHVVSLVDLEEQMQSGFAGRILHLGGCQTTPPKKQDKVREFMSNTGITMVTGFSKTVDWVESSALELLWFSHLQHYVHLRNAAKTFQKRYSCLVEATGFEIVLP